MGRWITILLWLIWLTATLLASSEAQAVRMPRGSFLIQPARSAAQLAKQVRTNPVVARRYARHFQVPAPEFAHYAQHQLGLRRLPRGGVFRVFFIRADGSIGSRVRYLPRGTLVFLHVRSGRPVLLGICGNPLTAALPGYVPPRRVTIVPPVSPSVTPPREPSLPEPAVQTSLLELPDPPQPPPLESFDLSVWRAEPLAASGEPVLEPLVARRKTFPLLPLLLVAGLGFSQGGEASVNPPAPVPEPASVMTLLAGMALLAVVNRRHREH
jgi:hypothetical protein